VARQTITDALKVHVKSQLLKNCRRNGLTIDSSKLKQGIIAIVSRFEKSCVTDAFEQLQSLINRDGWQVKWIIAHTPRELEKELPEDTLGILFTSSSLTVEMVEYLQAKQIPFVSSNQLPGYRNINWVDFDVAHSIRELLTPAVSRGYKHIGVIFLGHIENFNELLRKELLKVKRELKLPHEPYDDAVIYWQGSLDNILQQTVKFFQQKNSYPEVLISSAQLTLEQCRMLLELPQPPELLLTMVDAPDDELPKGVESFYNAISSIEATMQGYELLRSAIFTPNMYPVQISLKSKYIFQKP
jgi:DNA-binding LacI/PurR family transcriptional regulator